MSLDFLLQSASRAAAERDFRKGINGVNLPSDVETALSTFFQKNVRYMRTMKSEIRVLQEKVAKMEYERTKVSFIQYFNYLFTN